MPRVPVQLPGVAPQVGGISPPRAPGFVQMGDVVSEDTQRAGAGLERLGAILQRVQDDRDDAMTKRGDVQLSDAADQYYSAFSQRLRGDATPDAAEESLKAFDAMAKEIENGLANDTQKEQFRILHQSRRANLQVLLNRHAVAQTREFNIDETKQRRLRFERDAVTFYDSGDENQDPVYGPPTARQAFRTHSDTAVAEALHEAQLQGYGPDSEVAKAMVLETKTSIHAGVAQKLLSQGEPGKAQAYLGSLPEGSYDPEKMKQTLGAVARGGQDEMEAKIAGAVSDAMGLYKPMSREDQATFLVRAAQALDSVKDLDATTRDGAMDRITKDFERVRKANAESANALRDRVQAQLINNPGMSWRQLDPNDKQALEQNGDLGTIIAFSDSGNRYATDPQFDAMLESVPDEVWRTADPAVFAKATRGVLSNERQKYWLGRIEKARGTQDSKVFHMLSMEDEKKRAAKQVLNITREGPLSPADSDRVENWMVDFQKRVIEPWANANKRQPSEEEVRHLLDLEVADTLKKTTSGTIWDTTETVRTKDFASAEAQDYYVEVGGDKFYPARMPSVFVMPDGKPVNLHAEIADAIKAQGGLETTEEIVRRYNKVRDSNPELGLPDLRRPPPPPAPYVAPRDFTTTIMDILNPTPTVRTFSPSAGYVPPKKEDPRPPRVEKDGVIYLENPKK